MSVNDVEREIAELWTELKRLKMNKWHEVENSRKKIILAYALLVISWVLSLVLVIIFR